MGSVSILFTVVVIVGVVSALPTTSDVRVNDDATIEKINAGKDLSVLRQQSSCCDKLRDIPYLAPGASYSPELILGTCDRSVELTEDCFWRQCCQAKSHQSCLACCETKKLLGKDPTNCASNCLRCFTCDFPAGPDVPFTGPPKCGPGKCRKNYKCIRSLDNEYCTCVRFGSIKTARGN